MTDLLLLSALSETDKAPVDLLTPWLSFNPRGTATEASHCHASFYFRHWLLQKRRLTLCLFAQLFPVSDPRVPEPESAMWCQPLRPEPKP